MKSFRICESILIDSVISYIRLLYLRVLDLRDGRLFPYPSSDIPDNLLAKLRLSQQFFDFECIKSEEVSHAAQCIEKLKALKVSLKVYIATVVRKGAEGMLQLLHLNENWSEEPKVQWV